MYKIRYVTAVLTLTGFLVACGKGPKLDIGSDEQGSASVSAPSYIKVNDIECPSDACPAGSYTVFGNSSITIRGSVGMGTVEVKSTDSSGAFDNTNFTDGLFVFTTEVEVGVTRTISFRAVNEKGEESDPTTVVIIHTPALLILSPSLQGLANNKTDNGVTLRSFGFATVGANDVAVSGSTSLVLGYSNVMGRVSP